jgi:DNA-directed RNA polymerase subunit RPC12/RpoP
MASEIKLKCLRCGCEYHKRIPDNSEIEERTCPRCSSNSVRQIGEDKRAEN